MIKDKPNYKYLLSLYNKVDEFLSNKDIIQKELPDSIVSFSTVVEKILKIKLHTQNPILIFDKCHLDDNGISIIAMEKEEDIDTSNIQTILDRFQIVFKEIFTPDEIQTLKDIYKIRSSFVHGYKSDDKMNLIAEDIVKKMGKIWGKISDIAISLFGKDSIQEREPKKKYTDDELKQVLREEVKKMIQPSIHFNARSIFEPEYHQDYYKGYSVEDFMIGEKCPRCGAREFSLGRNENGPLSAYGVSSSFHIGGEPTLYKCRKCNLELTEKQYEIAKEILGDK